MRTLFLVMVLAAFLSGCSIFRSVKDNDCRRKFASDCYTKREKNLRYNKPDIEGGWGKVFVETKSLQVSLARRKASTVGCRKAAEKFHTQ